MHMDAIDIQELDMHEICDRRYLTHYIIGPFMQGMKLFAAWLYVLYRTQKVHYRGPRKLESQTDQGAYCKYSRITSRNRCWKRQK